MMNKRNVLSADAEIITLHQKMCRACMYSDIYNTTVLQCGELLGKEVLVTHLKLCASPTTTTKEPQNERENQAVLQREMTVNPRMGKSSPTLSLLSISTM